MKTVTKIILIAWLWLMVINAGTLGAIDTDVRLQMAHAWWTGTEEVQISPQMQPKVRGDIRFGIRGVGGKRYIFYKPGQALLMLPGDWLGTQLHRFFPIMESKQWRDLAVNFFVFIPLNVAAVVSCFWLLKLFGFSERIAGLTSITWLLGTTFFYYAQVQHQNNQILLFVTLGYATALACVRNRHSLFAILSGLALGAALLIRQTSIIHVFSVFLFFIGCLAYQSRDKLKLLKTAALWVFGFIPLALFGRIFDYMRFGVFWRNAATFNQLNNTDPIFSGLPELPANHPFTNPPHVGILGVLFSPAKSIFIYDPLLLPCLVLGAFFWKRLSPYIKWYLITVVLNLGLHIALTSRLDFWHGDTAWGARYQVTSVQLLLIPLIGVFIEYLGTTRSWRKWLMQGIITVAFIVQIASVTLPMNLEIYQKKLGMPGTRLDFRLGRRLINNVCLINSSISSQCLDNYPDKKRNLEAFINSEILPFHLQQKAQENKPSTKVANLVLLLWIFVLILALLTTSRYVFMGR